MILAASMLLISSPLGICYAGSIYWDRNETRNDALTDKEAPKLEMDKQAKSLGKLEVYDTGDVEDSVEDLYDQTEPVARPPAQPRSSVESPSSDQPSSRRSPATSRREDSRPAASAKPSDKKRGTTSATVSGQEDKSQGTKMKWGRVEVKPVGPKKQLQWGRTNR